MAGLSVTVTGTASGQNVFDWTTALDTRGNTNGDVTLVIKKVIDLQGEYAAMDNFLITSSDTQLDFS